MSGEALPAGPGEAGDVPSREPSADSGDRLVVRPSKHREMQVAKAPKRKLFHKARRKVFLEWLAATGNCVFSAAKAGVHYRTVWKHRMKDPRFAESFDRALEQGIVRAKARLIEDRPKGPIAIDGDLDEAELEPPDPQIVLNLVREYERAKAGRHKPGRAPRVASNAEVDAALAKRLKAYWARVRAEERGGSGAAPSAEGEEQA